MLLSDKYAFLKDYFMCAITSNNRAFPQSILFYGNDLDAQYALAKEIARLLNCKENKADDCSCLNCRWINDNVHPEVKTISRIDNKPEDDDSKKVISIKQSQMVKDSLINASEYHRVFIFCDRDDNGNIAGLNPQNFQAEAANSLLKIIEEPSPNITFIFLTRYVDDVLSTIISRSQCFFVPSYKPVSYDYSIIENIFTDYFNFDRKDVFDVSQNLQNMLSDYSIDAILEAIQNYILCLLKSNPNNTFLINHAFFVEEARKQAGLGLKPVNIFDDLCLKLIK